MDRIGRQIKVLIVDDSASFRRLLYTVLTADSAFEVIATAANPYIAANKLAREVPDVILLDDVMPRMNGIAFLKKIMAQYPIPVVFLYDQELEGGTTALRAIEYGAVEVFSKSLMEAGAEHTAIKIREAVKRAAAVKLKRKFFPEAAIIPPKLSADAVLQSVKSKSSTTGGKIIAIGASTGGTEAIKTFLETLPADAPGVVIVQHMPQNFTKSFAERLNELCKMQVKEAENGDLIQAGVALVAPGNQHMMVKHRAGEYYVELNQGPLVNRHRPSVDVLFRSAAIYAGKSCVGILLTGMGDDGAKGLLEIREAGGRTIAQDEESSVVFGMPKEAVELNAAEIVLPLQEIAPYVMHKALK